MVPLQLNQIHNNKNNGLVHNNKNNGLVVVSFSHVIVYLMLPIKFTAIDQSLFS
jgi:hypothetical protein